MRIAGSANFLIFLKSAGFLIGVLFALFLDCAVSYASCVETTTPALLQISQLIGKNPEQALQQTQQALAADPNDQDRAWLYALQAESYGRLSRAEDAKRVALQGMQEQSVPGLQTRVNLLWILATNSYQTDELNQVRAIVLSERSHWPRGSVEDICLMISLGNIDRLKADFGSAARYLYTAYRTSDKPEHLSRHIEAARLMARLLSDVNNIPAALALNNEIIGYEAAHDQTFMLGFAHAFRGIYLNGAARYGEAIIELETALHTAKEFGDEVGQAYINQHICRTHVGLKNWALARPYCISSREYLYSQKEDGYLQSDTLLAEIDLAENNPSSALTRLNAVINSGSGTTSINQFQQFKLRAEAYRRLGEDNNALTDLSRFIELSENWNKASDDRRLIVMRERYLTDLQLERTNKLERTLTAERKAADERTLLYLVVVASSVMAIGFLVYIYFTERQKHRLVAETANTDMLTGLSNRRRLEQQLKLVHENVLASGAQYCIAIIDIDHFKAINDTYGHLVGDQVLQHAARIMSEKLPSDVSVGRWGGEEFLIIFANKDEEQSAANLQDLRSILSTESFMGNSHIKVEFSAGVSANKAGSISVEDTVRRADLALYEAKASGRNRTCML